MKIIIDNGHGEGTPGKRSPQWADGSQLLEWKYNREIAHQVEAELKQHGIDVVRIVHENSDVSLTERCRRANEVAEQAGAGNCLLVSIHCNASMNGQAQGWEICTYSDEGDSTRFANVFWHTAKDLLPGNTKMRIDSPDHPVRIKNFQILRGTRCPAVLTENLFMDNETDCRYLLSPEGRETIVRIHVQAILKIVKEHGV